MSDKLDAFSSGLIQKYAAPGAPEAAGAPNVDAFSKDLIAKGLAARAAGLDGPILDSSKDWDFFREMLDGATFGAYSASVPERIQNAQKAWTKEHSGATALARTVGETVPTVVASTLLGQGEVGLAQLAKIPELGKFLTGSSEGNALMRLGSHAAWGAQQGLTGAGLENAAGKDADYAGSAAVGATAGPLANLLFAPLQSTISPQIAQLARDYAKETGVPLKLSQIPGAPVAVKAYAKLFNMGREDVPALTESLMRSTGSNAKLASPQTITAARQDIKNSMHAAFPGSGLDKLTDDETPAVFEQLRNATNPNSAQGKALALAQNQWTNSLKVERMMNSSKGTDGLIDPKVVLGEVQSNATSYPGGLDASSAAKASGNPVNINTLGQGASAFVRQPASTALHAGELGVGALGMEAAHNYLQPLLEGLVPHLEPMLAASGLYAGANAAVGGMMNSSPRYLNMLLNGGPGPIGNPLVPLMQQWYGNEMGDTTRGIGNAVNPVTPAQGAENTTPPSELQPIISAAGTKYNVDPDLLARQLYQESRFKNLPPNKAGAAGVAQFIPETAKTYGVDVTDPASSINGQAHMMSDLHQRFNGNTGLALAGYNWGPTNVQRWLANGADPQKLPTETKNYVQNITGKPIESWLGNTSANGSTRITIPLDPKNIAPSANALAASFGPQAGSDAAINTLTGSP